MKPTRRFNPAIHAIAIILIAAACALPALAYQYPLSSTDIRDAYFLGRSKSDGAASTLAQYVHALPAPESGPNIAQISVDTPFTQVAAYSSAQMNYDAPTAAQDFEGKPMMFRIHVQIYLTPTYQLAPTSAPNALAVEFPAFWQDFKFKLIQDKEIHYNSLSAGFIYPQSSDGSGPQNPIGAAVTLIFDPAKIQSEPATIRVESPDGHQVETTFDLSSLR